MHPTKGNMSGQHRRQKTAHAGNYFLWPEDLPDGFHGLRYYRASTMTDEELQTCYKGCGQLKENLRKSEDC